MSDLTELIRKTRLYPSAEYTLRIVDRLPQEPEYSDVQHLIIQQGASSKSPGLDDETLAQVLPRCPNLLTVSLSGIADTSDRTLVLLSKSAPQLEDLNLSGCHHVSDVGILELASDPPRPLRRANVCGVQYLTDPSISAIAKACPDLTELWATDLPLISPVCVRDVWTHSKQLAVLRLANCPQLGDEAFPSLRVDPGAPLDIVSDETHASANDREKPLPHRPNTWLESLHPLHLTRRATHLRVLDLENCTALTDAAIAGIVYHCPVLNGLILSGVTQLTDEAMLEICRLRYELEVLKLAHLPNVTDRGIVAIARSCVRLESVDVSFCTGISDMAVFEIACLPSLRRLEMVRAPITDQAIFFITEHNKSLERIYASYCDRLSTYAIHVMLRQLPNLKLLDVTGIPGLRDAGVQDFSQTLPHYYDANRHKAHLRLIGREQITQLLKFLDEREMKERDVERNGTFLPGITTLIS